MNNAVPDIVDVKAAIRSGRLCVLCKGKRLLLCDTLTEESVLLSDIEVKPVIHAKWKFTDSPYCSACNSIAEFKYRYCPNCGAKMDGEENAAD